MNTDELIARLAAEPLKQRSVSATLAAGLLAGTLVSAILMLSWLHMRPDLMPAMATGAFWMKFAYSAALAALAFPLAARLARPTGHIDRSARWLALPVLALLVLSGFELYGLDHAARMRLMMGSSSSVCPWFVALLSLPILAGLFISLRSLAPTRLVSAGLVSGVLAGAFATIIYEFHCTETAAPFVVIWYTFGMALAGGIGGALGSLVLRWR